MLFWTIRITLISIILIFLVHHLINFFKSTLTVPKIKDLVNSPSQKYENMFHIIGKVNSNTSPSNYVNDFTSSDLLPKPDEQNMKSELKNFLKKQLNVSTNGTDISSLDSMIDNHSYSTFKL